MGAREKMASGIDSSITTLGDGTVSELESGRLLFKLDSCRNNPIIKPQDIGASWRENGRTHAGSVFNGGAQILQDKVILTPRAHKRYRKGMFFDEELGIERVLLENYVSEIWPLVSEDAIHFARLDNVVIRGDGTDHSDFLHGIDDVRIVKYGGRYLLVGRGKIKPSFKSKNSDRIAVYSTTDFKDIIYHGIVESFDSGNPVPFPNPIDGRVYMLFRFYPNIHLDILEEGVEQLLNPSEHAYSWGRINDRREKSLLLEAGKYPHEKEKVGAGPPPIKTEKGWLLIYHAVGEIGEGICKAYGRSQMIDRGYSVCAAILDQRDPTKVLCRTQQPLYIPSSPWELQGSKEYPVDIPAVVFPVGAVVRKNKLLLYCGAGDKYVVLLSCSLSSLIDYLWKNCRLNTD